MFWMLEWLLAMALSMLGGAVVGLIPFFVGKYQGKPGLGRLGWRWSMIAGLLFLQVPVAIGFVVAIFVRPGDYYPAAPVSRPAARGAEPASSGSLGVTCLSGPLKGRTYAIGANGLLIGRDQSCAICFGSEVPGISRQHCSLRWQEGALMLTDLGSTYGTYLSDGRKLPPQYPTQVFAGSRFYLAERKNLLQIVITM